MESPSHAITTSGEKKSHRKYRYLALLLVGVLPSLARAEHDKLGNYVGPGGPRPPVGSNPMAWDNYYNKTGGRPKAFESVISDNSLYGKTRPPAPRVGEQRPAGDGGTFTYLSATRPSYLPYNPTVVPAFLVSGTVAFPIAVFGTVVGAVAWGGEWIVYLSSGGYWRYTPPPRPYPTIQARPIR